MRVAAYLISARHCPNRVTEKCWGAKMLETWSKKTRGLDRKDSLLVYSRLVWDFFRIALRKQKVEKECGERKWR